MISKIIIIKSSGIRLYSKTFHGVDIIDDDFISGFLTTILDISLKIGGGEIRSLNFRNFNMTYSYDDEELCIFIIVADIYDPETELSRIMESMKAEFLSRYRDNIINWDDEISKYEKFDDYTEKNVYIPPKILLIGEDGVGKTTIMNLFPGEFLIELDDDMNEVIQKIIELSKFKRIEKCEIREINIDEVNKNPQRYNELLASANIVCFVTNSAASNLGRTRNDFSQIRPKVKRADIYIIANFQDLVDISFEPGKIEELFGIKTFGFSAISENATHDIYSIINEMLGKIIL
ncbi:MAG: hypothetical protein ACFE8N_10660 [Promethearchaeota archaeon]